MNTATKQAFSAVRKKLGDPKMPPVKLIANQDQVLQMTSDDGLMQWVDGSCFPPKVEPSSPPSITKSEINRRMLWVIGLDEVVYAAELGDFGKKLEDKKIKHTNLTGGGPAYSGGELIFFNGQSTVVVNGDSGRYGPRSASELYDVVSAFALSGYAVWSMGFDVETGKPFQFYPGAIPTWVS